jgi:hypothetical protein
MSCKKVSKLLSEFFDGVLDADMSARVSQHLKLCEGCRKELDNLSILHGRMSSMEKLQAPDYLYQLVQNRLTDKNKNSWRNQLKDALAFRWSRIRTTEVQFYWTRVLGTLMATFCFCFVIISAIDPFREGPNMQAPGRTSIFNEDRQEFNLTMGEIGGRPALEKIKKDDQIEAEMDRQSLANIGKLPIESGSEAKENENFSVLLSVDDKGKGKLDNVIDMPENRDLLPSLNNLIEGARYRPASMNGRSVSSLLFMIFNNITVFSEE